MNGTGTYGEGVAPSRCSTDPQGGRARPSSKYFEKGLGQESKFGYQGVYVITGAIQLTKMVFRFEAIVRECYRNRM